MRSKYAYAWSPFRWFRSFQSVVGSTARKTRSYSCHWPSVASLLRVSYVELSPTIPPDFGSVDLDVVFQLAGVISGSEEKRHSRSSVDNGDALESREISVVDRWCVRHRRRRYCEVSYVFEAIRQGWAWEAAQDSFIPGSAVTIIIDRVGERLIVDDDVHRVRRETLVSKFLHDDFSRGHNLEYSRQSVQSRQWWLANSSLKEKRKEKRRRRRRGRETAKRKMLV